jgi:hypothetical protein
LSENLSESLSGVCGGGVSDVTRGVLSRFAAWNAPATRSEIGTTDPAARAPMAAGSIGFFGTTFGALDAAAKPSSSEDWKLATTSLMAYRRFPGRQGPDNVNDASASCSYL